MLTEKLSQSFSLCNRETEAQGGDYRGLAATTISNAVFREKGCYVFLMLSTDAAVAEFLFVTT